MLFNSINFVLFYLVVTFLYFILPFKSRWFLLLAASCFFYMAFVPVYILILGFTIVIDYFAGIYIETSVGPRRKMLLICSLIANIGILAIFKYFNFLNENVTLVADSLGWHNHIPFLTMLLPIGLSFHTFQAMSYTIEVYRGNQKAEKHFGIYSLYVMFYPQLVAGPIERPQNILHQFHIKHEFSYFNLVSGLKQMAYGLFKKLVVADRLSIYVNSVYNNPELHNGSSVVISSIFFAVQIYCDFSGYSDIAIGSARTMGFELMTNFRRPYFSKTIPEFWSKWHISLSTWFRDYLYIPLGGNRVAAHRRYFNLFIVFMISGLWHGANYTFILWGALHGFYQVVGLITKPYVSKFETNAGIQNNIIWRLSRGLLTFSLVTFAWIFFRANSIHDAFTLIGNLRSFGEAPFLGNGINQFAHCLLALTLLFSIEYCMEYYPEFTLFNNRRIWVRWGSVVALLFIILVFGVFNGGQFIYFQF
ncbi:D-alanyl-lipoteichoic acid acyltransferase DltB, MBOAT superfamily [Dyadobacter koreensis]|uniref:D-alanyl-lipoteichoic acid acyltransferase DltB, MBOAT superfamily n=2 Tax=Dyadobacter koreensis TaxID=408657 RepID=A0A1H6V4K9_9BACT|nr:D-alanyl-lipoteichoic acid acyltransferase DltB, MBOAT superfamily [Dyadobacter koreensis]